MVNDNNYIPYLPPIPNKICGKRNFVKNLTDRAENEWQFLFREINDIPSPYADNQDYDFEIIGEDEWQDIIVPSSAIMQGFDIENNTEYYYRRKIKLPKKTGADRLVLRFEGAYSNARVWINNKYVKTHIGGFTAWDCDITDFSYLDEITLIVGVTDIEGNKKGIWNPNGETVSNAAWASYYAHCNIGGIIRNITLFTLPEDFIARTHINTRLMGSDAIVETNIEVCSKSDTIEAVVVLESENNEETVKVNCSLDKKESSSPDASYNIIPNKKWSKTHKNAFINDEKYKKFYIPYKYDFSADNAGKISVFLKNPKLWDAEHPNLYTLKIKLFVNGKEWQENIHKIGIREITYGGDNGTDKNKVYINGREIKLRGVCRHDASHLYGRSLTEEDIYSEILTYKKNNINFIRTSHYPASDYLLSVCDELGMYVEQENAACFKGANNFEIYNAPQEFLQSFAEMIESARNHTSVIIWSLANESDFEKTYAFRAEYDYAKNIDVSRPVIFSYPNLVHTKPLPYDIKSKHYAKVTGKLGDKNVPLLHDEFAHVSCYNTDRLKQDNSVRDFWGESIKLGWDNIFKTDGALGCAVWAATDDIFCIPKGTSESHQSHSDGGYAGYGEWGCIFDAFHREKPEAYLTKKAFTPVLLDESKTEYGAQVKLHVQNRFDHTDLNEVKMTVTDSDHIIYNDYINTSVAPHCSGIISFENSGAHNNFLIEFYFHDILIDSYKLNSNEDKPKKPNRKAYDAEEYIDIPMNPLSYKKAKFKITKEKTSDKINIKVSPLNIFSHFAASDDCVLKIKLRSAVKSVSWQRKAQYSVYPNWHISRAEGTAFPIGTDNKYGIVPATPWEKDNENYFLYPVSLGKRGLSNDFMTRRNYVNRFTVSLQNGKDIELDGRGINVLVCPSSEDRNIFEIRINCGCYYPDLQWGNYFGKRFRNIRNRCMSFSVSCFESEE